MCHRGHFYFMSLQESKLKESEKGANVYCFVAKSSSMTESVAIFISSVRSASYTFTTYIDLF